MPRISSFIVLLGVLLVSLFSSCDVNLQQSTDDLPEHEITVEPFDKIELKGGFNALIMQSNEVALSIQTSDQNMQKIDVEVRNKTLYINSRQKNITPNEIKLNISIDKLTSLKIEGGLNLHTEGVLTLDDITIKIEGGINASINLTAQTIKTNAEGAVNLEFEGSTDILDINAEGASNIDAGLLKARIVSCRLAGAGNALVYPTESLYAKIEGIGKISYRGSPAITKNIEGIGLVYRK